MELQGTTAVVPLSKYPIRETEASGCQNAGDIR